MLTADNRRQKETGIYAGSRRELRPRVAAPSVERGFMNGDEQPDTMAADISDRVRAIAEARGLPESEVLQRALDRGLEDLWEDLVVAQYLDGELDREEAVERVGRAKVERAERERELVEEDVDWGLNA